MTGEAQQITRRAEPVSSGQGAAPAGFGSAAPVAPAATVPAERSLLVDQNKKLSVGDMVSIEIMEDRDAPVSKVVTATGDLDVPPLSRVRVAGKTTREAAAEIERQLEAEFYHKATVRLSIDQVNTKATMGKIHVTGEVRAPGVIEIFAGDNLTLNEAILRAGGVKEFGNPSKVQVTRRSGGKNESFVVDVKKIEREGDVANDMVLGDGDRVFVPRKWINF
jgi:protein involved in polysaccharide export with SLBB domain